MEPGAPVAVSRHLGQSKQRFEPSCSNKRLRIHTGFAMGMTSAMKYAASLAVPMAAGYVFDHYNVTTYYMSGGIAFAGVVSVGFAWKLFISNEQPIDPAPSVSVEGKKQTV